MHADRTNRFALTLFGLLILVIGAAAMAASVGVFGTKFEHHTLFANQVSAYIGQHGSAREGCCRASAASHRHASAACRLASSQPGALTASLASRLALAPLAAAIVSCAGAATPFRYPADGRYCVLSL